MVEEQERQRVDGGSHQPDKMETLVRSSQQRRRVGHGGVKMGGGGSMGGKKKDG